MSRTAEALPRRLAALPHAWSLGRIALTTGVLALLGWALLSVGDVSEALRATTAIWLRPDLLVVFLIGYTAAFGLRAMAWSILLGAAPHPGPAAGCSAFCKSRCSPITSFRPKSARSCAWRWLPEPAPCWRWRPARPSWRDSSISVRCACSRPSVSRLAACIRESTPRRSACRCSSSWPARRLSSSSRAATRTA